MWDERYSAQEYAYGTEPNVFFREQLDLLPAGTLLLPAEGEGRNAVYAARHGWTVTAFDQSGQGKIKAEALARKHNVRLNYIVGDALTISFPSDHFNAAGFVYTHFPEQIRKEIFRDVIHSLKKNGVIIMEVFSTRQIDYQKEHQSGGPKEIDQLYTAGIVQDLLEGCSVSLIQETEVRLSEGMFHNGLASVIRCVARKR